MTNLAWSEIRDRAIAFSRTWAGTSSESAEKQTFWNEFFAIFGKERRTVGRFEEAVTNIRGKYGFIDLLWPHILLVEHKSAGKSLSTAESQAFEYVDDLIRAERFEDVPRYIVISDFARFALYDLEPGEAAGNQKYRNRPYTVVEFPLSELHQNIRRFAFIKGESAVRIEPDDPANQEAYDRMCEVHDELERLGFEGPDLERLLVRILFCLFADDTGVFEPMTFESFVRTQTRPDGSDLGARLNELFDILNTSEDRWSATARDNFAGFRYVNGDLFKDRLGFPPFTRATRDALLAATDFHWARVSPAVFGSLFQGVLLPKERRQQGAHYTSERDIMKVIRSLFLDELRTEFDTIKADRSTRRKSRLEEFQGKLRSLKFLDPACGCGNFLVLAYREVRALELDVAKERQADEPDRDQRMLIVRELIKVNVDQFYGIELGEWPVRIAEVAMWLMDQQMNQIASEAFGQMFDRLPLKSTPHIVEGNALKMDWNELLPEAEGSYVLGNPPYVGKKARDAAQQADMELVWGDTHGAGIFDYVTCWYRRAAEYVARTRATVAFVSTNSITQGEQVGLLWTSLFQRWHVKIHFAHRTFSWTSEGRGAAHVHVVIIGFAGYDRAPKHIYEYDDEGHMTVNVATNIGPYLIEGSDLGLSNRENPISPVPEMTFGSMPNDDGNLLLTDQERTELLEAEPDAAPLVRRMLSAHEYLNGENRWCIWLKDVDPAVVRRLPQIMHRIEAVRAYRARSKRTATQRLASQPMLFGEIRQPEARFVVIPRHSSERRTYIPLGYFDPDVIVSDSCASVEGATAYHFGMLSSSMHMAWVRTVCGRLESRYRYSNKLVYNNFPWPIEPTDRAKSAVGDAAQTVLDVRAPFLPPNGTSTLADLYDPLTMPAPLAKAHADLDRAVDRCYRAEAFRSDRERVEHLFALYEKLTAPLAPVATTKVKRARRAKAKSRGA